VDALTRSVTAAAGRAGLPTMILNRHLDALRPVVRPDDEALLVRTCLRADRKGQGDLLLTVTGRSLLVTRERFLRGVQLYLAADRAELTDLRWDPHERMPYMELSFGYRGTRYLLWFAGFQPAELTAVDADLTRVFAR
jgi:hypothetical protein